MILTINFKWTTKTSLRIHTGLARAGSVDRMVRERGGKPVLPGEAVKGSIREAAERILRWHNNPVLPERTENTSIPTHPVLRRLFAPQAVNRSAEASAARYYFRSCIASVVPTSARMEITSTAINDESGTAEDNMLRSIELWRRGIEFDLVIEGMGGDWGDGKPDRKDLSFLLMAVATVDAIGGGWGIGCGELSLSELTYRLAPPPADQYLNESSLDLASVPSMIGSLDVDTALGAVQ